MSSIQSKLLRSKQRMEQKLKEKQERRDKLGKEIFDFPNLTIPLSMFTFMPAFIILTGTARYFTHNRNVISVSILLAIFGIVMGNYLCRLERRWFTFYGTKGIIKEIKEYNKKNIFIYFLCCIAIIMIGTFIQNDGQLLAFFAGYSIVCIYLALHKEALLWDMLPAYLLGFRKCIFIPQHEDNHVVRNKKQTGIIRKPQKIEEDSRIEGTFLGNSWYYLRKETEK